MKNNYKLKEDISIPELETLINKCLHCGNLPKVYSFEHEGDRQWMIECDCGISTVLFNSPEELLNSWNSVYVIINNN